jgi:hypothetical protein
MPEVKRLLPKKAAKVRAPVLIKKVVGVLHENVVDVCFHIGYLALGN